MPEIDYDKIAECYDRHRGVGGPYQARLVELALASDARRVLEIGPGTGNNTAALLAAYPCEVIGALDTWLRACDSPGFKQR